MKKQKPSKCKNKYISGIEKDRHRSRQNANQKRQADHSAKSRTPCPCGNENLLPWWFTWMVVMVTMVVRVNYVRRPENWWILHPDEVFQSVEDLPWMEGIKDGSKFSRSSTQPYNVGIHKNRLGETVLLMAFSEVYGYGFRPYEYLPPIVNATTPAEQQMLRSGMFGLRSFMLPRIFAAVLTVAKHLGIHGNAFVTCRIFHAIVSSALPITVFMFTRKLFGCRLIATLTCAMTASSFHLTLFGTHTLVNSFIAPFLFLGLTLCLPTSSCHDELPSRGSKPNMVQRSRLKQNGRNCITKQTENCKQSFEDQNGNLVSRNDDDGRRLSDGSVSSTNSSLNENTCPVKAYRRWSGSDSSASTSTDENVDVLQTDTTFAFFGTSIQMLEVMKFIGGGFLVGLSCYIRVDSILFVVIVFIPVLFITNADWTVKIFGTAWSCLGGSFGLLLGGLEDYNRYGQWFLSPVQWIKYNVFNERASVIYTPVSNSNYLDVLFPGYVTKLTAIALAITLVYSLVNKTEMRHKYSFCSILFSFITLCIIYSTVGHSQQRFLHNVFILQTILFSYVFHHVLQLLAGQGYIDSYRRNGCIKLSLVLVTLSCFATMSYTNFPSASDGSASSWSYRDAKESRDSNMCLNFISKQTNVRGVVLDTPLYASGGYSILNHDVPILAKIHNEYHLYKSRTDTILGNKSKIRILNNFSDYIHNNNQHYRRILLAGSDTFNYAVTSFRHRPFYENMKYRELFSTGKLIVFERNLSEPKEAQLNKKTSALHVGYNATVLEYEANWLITNGLYQLAIVRAERALELSTDRVRTFQQLVLAYFELGLLEKAREYERLCIRVHGYDACSKQQEKVILHDDYKRFERK